ncbi:MAG: dTDP-4-dehydrorhamnose reductase [Nitrospinae bacterium]|nr:dTDP-4-dehydrorhamnose reductase [Nitrospinota bacterium]
MNVSSPNAWKILLIGKDGQVGGQLSALLQPLGKLVTFGEDDLDLTQADRIRETLREVRPQVIVNAAAYTAVDKAEEEAELAQAVNATAPTILAEEAKRQGAALVHFSTDYVFDGNKPGPYTEEDAPNPLSVYGRTKLAGDEAIRSAGPPHLIFRTGWVYGLQGKNFLLTIQRLAKERDELKIVDDQVGSPTWCRTIAQITANVLSQVLPEHSPGDLSRFEQASGLYNLVCTGQTSWFGFAKAIVETSPTTRDTKLIPIPTSEYPTAARRPANSVLATEKLRSAFGITPPAWDITLNYCLSR